MNIAIFSGPPGEIGPTGSIGAPGADGQPGQQGATGEPGEDAQVFLKFLIISFLSFQYCPCPPRTHGPSASRPSAGVHKAYEVSQPKPSPPQYEAPSPPKQSLYEKAPPQTTYEKTPPQAPLYDGQRPPENSATQPFKAGPPNVEFGAGKIIIID